MNVVRRGRGDALLLAHCASLDPEAENAKARLEDALGPELAQKLVHALTAGAPARRRRGYVPGRSSPRRRTSSQIAANPSSAITNENAPEAPTAFRPK